MSDRLTDFLRANLIVVGVANMAVGLWALISPHGWYRTFPGLGHHWVSALGPYDEHLARDAGSGLLAVGVLLVWAALTPRAGLLRPALVASLVFSVPHLAYHVASADDLPTADNIVNLVLLTAAVVIPAALLWTSRPHAEVSPRSAIDADGMRLAPAPAADGGPVLRFTYRYLRRHYGTVLGSFVPLSHHPGVLRGTVAMELALEHAGEVDPRLKDLAATRAASLVGCEFCIDFGSALLEHAGAPPEQVAELPRWRESGAFSELDRLVLEYTEALTRTPVEVPDELYARLAERFTEAQLVELTAAITFENHRARMNNAFRVGSQGFASRPAAAAATV
ncbi:MAG TPA: carboxymuconolactone decarboxylase family protein [Thermoleophilaceae bacterium]